MKLANTYRYLKKDLDYIEKSLNKAIQAEHPVLHQASEQLLQAGGKRIRPVFVLLSGYIGNYDKEQLASIAVALELIHMATLVHDDVVDDAELRRGKPTVKHIYGNRVAMYTGDYILARALEEIAMIDNPEIHQLLSQTLVEVCLGEIEQIEFKYNLNQQLRDYLRRIRRKTAILIATSCKVGALSSGLSVKEAKKLYQYGYYIGMSYQIIDDILDFTSSEQELGKPTASDLLQGNITLPVLFAMEDPLFNQRLHDLFAHPETITHAEMDALLHIFGQTKAIEYAYQMSESYLNKAFQCLDGLPNSKAKQTLIDIAISIGNRRS